MKQIKFCEKTYNEALKRWIPSVAKERRKESIAMEERIVDAFQTWIDSFINRKAHFPRSPWNFMYIYRNSIFTDKEVIKKTKDTLDQIAKQIGAQIEHVKQGRYSPYGALLTVRFNPTLRKIETYPASGWS